MSAANAGAVDGELKRTNDSPPVAGDDSETKETRKEDTFQQYLTETKGPWFNWILSETGLRPLMEVDPLDRIRSLVDTTGRTLQEDKLRVPIDLLVNVLSFLPPATNSGPIPDLTGCPNDTQAEETSDTNSDSGSNVSEQDVAGEHEAEDKKAADAAEASEATGESTSAPPPPPVLLSSWSQVSGATAAAKVMQCCMMMMGLVLENDWVADPMSGFVPYARLQSLACQKEIADWEATNPLMGTIMAMDGTTRPHLVPPTYFEAYEALMYTSTPRFQRQGVLLMRKLLCVDNADPALTEKICSSSRLSLRLKHFLRYSDPQLQFDTAWLLTNVSSGEARHCRFVMSLASSELIQLLGSPSQDCRTQAVWALGNMAGEGAKFRDQLISEGSLEAVCRLLREEMALDQPGTDVLHNAAWALSNHVRAKPLVELDKCECAFPLLMQFLASADDELVVDAAWAFSYLTDESPERTDYILSFPGNERLLQLLTQLLSAPTSAKITPAIRALGNICTGTNEQTMLVVKAGILQEAHFLLVHPKRSIRKEICWTLSNITACGKEGVVQLIQNNLFPSLLQACVSPEVEVRKEAVFAIANATDNVTRDEISYIAQWNPWEVLLQHDEKDIVRVGLEAVRNILDGLGQSDNDTVPTIIAASPYLMDRVSELAETMEEAQSLSEAHFESLSSHGQEDNYVSE